jgi:hypothetical protein
MLQGQKDLNTVTKRILSELGSGCQRLTMVPSIFSKQDEEFAKCQTFCCFATYAYKEDKNIPSEFAIGEGLVGQCAFEKERILLTNVPSNYIKVTSSLGKGKTFQPHYAYRYCSRTM